METLKKNTGELILYSSNFIENKINECIATANPMIKYGCPENCKLYIPKFALDILIKKLKSSEDFGAEFLTSYRGFQIIEGYELAIILVHEDYPLFNDEKLINKIWITY